MSGYGLLIDYKWCTGCHSCEVACQMEHGFAPDTHGIKVHQVGPTPIGDGWLLDYMPNPTGLCDMCTERTSAGKLPACVHHCQSKCMKYGPVSELAADLAEKPNQLLFS